MAILVHRHVHVALGVLKTAHEQATFRISGHAAQTFFQQ
jgi:hypothetical protein